MGLPWSNIKKKGNPNPIEVLFKELIEQKWYWEDRENVVTSNQLLDVANNNPKKKYFLIRDGMAKADTYTLEVCFAGTVQKISLQDVNACRNYVKNLKSNGYKKLAKGVDCDWGTTTEMTKDSLNKQALEEDHQKHKNKGKKKN